MRIQVNGVRLYVDIEGAGLVPDGDIMREKPTLILLHGGPGADHSIYKPGFSALSDIAQIVYYDHRGCGRSEDGDPESGRSTNGVTTSSRSATHLASRSRSCWALRSAVS